MVPTKRFWALVALGVPIACLGAFVRGAEQFVWPYDVALLVLLIGTSRMTKGLDAIRIVRRTEAILSVRVPNVVELKLLNEGPEPIDLRVRDEAPLSCQATGHEFHLRLEPDRETVVRYTVTPTERGNDPFRGTFVRVLAPLGLAWVDRRVPTEAPARVYPNVQALQEFDLLKQKGRLNMMGVRRSRIKGIGAEFESLRDYNDDDYRHIDWKGTARRGKLVVRNYEQERNQAVLICVDVGRHMLSEVAGVRKLDYALDSSLMLMHAAERAGDQVGLLVFNDIVKRYLAPKKGRAQVAAILDAVHSLQAEPVQPDYQGAFGFLTSRWKRRSLIVLFTDAENDDQARELSEALAHLNRRHLLMVVRVADPKLKELRRLGVAGPRDLFLRASAEWYGSDRRQADSRLRAAGIQSIEAEPDELSGALVSAYIRVKELAMI